MYPRLSIWKITVWKSMRNGDYSKISILTTMTNWNLSFRKCYWKKNRDFWNIMMARRTSRTFCFWREILSSWIRSISSTILLSNQRNDANYRLLASVLRDSSSIPFWRQFLWERERRAMKYAGATAQTAWSPAPKVECIKRYWFQNCSLLAKIIQRRHWTGCFRLMCKLRFERSIHSFWST